MKNENVPDQALIFCVLNTAHDAIIATDESQKIILFNQSAEKQFGYSADEVVGKQLNILLPPSTTITDNQQISKFFTADQTVRQMNEEIELFGRRKDGTIFPCEASTAKAVYGDQPIIVTVLRDTLKRRLEIEIHREKNEYLENLLDYANAPIIVWNSQYEIIRFNKAFESLTGRNEKYVIGKYLEILFPTASRHHSMELIRKTVEGERLEAVEIDILHIDGSVQTLLWNSATIMSPDKKTAIGTIAQGMNITKRKQEEEEIVKLIESLEKDLNDKIRQIDVIEDFIAELNRTNKELTLQNEENEKRIESLIIAKDLAEESDELKGVFLQNISHKIRTPLNGIIGFSELLGKEELNKEEIKEFTSLIGQSGKRLIEIINNILDISKIQTGQVKAEKKPILIKSMFSELFDFFNPVAQAKRIRLKYYNQEDENRTIYSDEAKLNQILTNLISNALKFTESGDIEFGYEIKDDVIQFFVKDTGPGIPKGMHDKVFDKFVQGESYSYKNYEGAGLGLSICKGLVELLGGKIWVESEINKGSSFYFLLPYYFDTESTKTGDKKSGLHGKRPHRVILIAEDDWISFQYLRIILEKLDITVLHAENGEQAVELVRNTAEIDLILMDIKMPVMDGIEATRIIKRLRPDLPIIAQTAYTYSEDKTKITAVGCDEYLPKPLEYGKLNELLKIYLN